MTRSRVFLTVISLVILETVLGMRSASGASSHEPATISY